MKLEVFKVLVEKLKNQAQKEREAYQVGVDLFEFTADFHSIISILIGSYYGQDGLETFDWWCFDKEWGTREDLKMTDRDGTELCKTVEDLHKYLEKNQKDDYELPKQMSSSELEATVKNIFTSFNK